MRRFGRSSARALLLGAVAALALAAPAMASAYKVYVGYSDGLRGPGFFPSPWQGDPGVMFLGSSAPYDSGAIMIVNTSGAPLLINSVGVTINGGGGWGAPTAWSASLPLSIPNGDKLILTQTTQYDFDTSDGNHIPGATYGNLALGCTGSGADPQHANTCPVVTINGINFFDSGHVLDTGGFDFAANGSNESFAWRPIGTFGGQKGGEIPEPLTLSVFGMGLAGLLGLRRRRKNI